MKKKSRYRLANISLNLKAYYRQISERLRHKERKVSEGYIEEIVKFPPIKKEKALTKKRTDVKDAHDRYFQNKPSGSYQIPGFDIIIKRVSSQPIKNKDNNPLIDQINNLEEKYLEIVSQNWLKNKTLLNGDDKFGNF